AAIPKKANEEVETLDDLADAVELFDKQVSLGRNDEAFFVFSRYLQFPMLYRLNAANLAVRLLLQIFPNGSGQAPALDTLESHFWALDYLARGFSLSGQPGKALEVFEQVFSEALRSNPLTDFPLIVCSRSESQRMTGQVLKAEKSARIALLLSGHAETES